MLYTLKAIYLWLLPPGLFILLLALVTIYLTFTRSRARYVTLSLALAFYLLSIEPVGNALLAPLERSYVQPTCITQDALIVLGAGATGKVWDIDGMGQLSDTGTSRLLTAARLYRQTQLPIIVCGGQVYAGSGNEAEIASRVLYACGVPYGKIICESKSRNTAENIRNAQAICKEKGLRSPLLVTSAWHIPRAMSFCEREGLAATAYPTAYQVSGQPIYTAMSFLPRIGDFYNSCIAIREYAGLVAAKMGLQ